MNILILNCDGKVVARPDTTVDKENGDFYMPDGCSQLMWAPVLYARISKAGKAVRKEFAERYYDSVAFGALLYPDGDSLVYDHSTLLPYPLYNKVTLDADENEFCVAKDGKEIFRCSVAGLRAKIEDALVACSRNTSVRIGDFVAVELSGTSLLAGVCDTANSSENSCALESCFCENKNIDIRINY